MIIVMVIVMVLVLFIVMVVVIVIVIVIDMAYILKAGVLEVQTPQIIWIFRKIRVWERKNYKLCSIEFCHKEQKL